MLLTFNLTNKQLNNLFWLIPQGVPVGPLLEPRGFHRRNPLKSVPDRRRPKGPKTNMSNVLSLPPSVVIYPELYVSKLPPSVQQFISGKEKKYFVTICFKNSLLRLVLNKRFRN